MGSKAIILAHYLPQFHLIRENDEWWGPGFTEWTNTVKARPLFRGHYQPNLPSDLGFYDLRIKEVRQQQADLAKHHGITGFAYWHYWFGNGRRLLEKPFNDVIQIKEPDFPFCLAWANESWTGVWHGLKDRVLMEQFYPGEEDDKNHFYEILPAFKDKRYIKIDSKPVFIVYKPDLIPNPLAFTALWNELAIENDFKGIYFIGIRDQHWDYSADGFNAKSVHPLYQYIGMLEANPYCRLWNKLNNKWLRKGLQVYRYADLVKKYDLSCMETYDFIPTLLPNWDNTPRSGKNGVILHRSDPEIFYHHFKSVLNQAMNSKINTSNLILLKSWNEWAEGNYLEPDVRWGSGYLESIKKAIAELKVDSTYYEYIEES